MPIKGLTESRRLPRLGKIHLGVKKVSTKTGAEYPSATEYFVVPPEIAKVYGERPTELPIIIPIDDEEKWANQYYRRYSRTRGLVCKGDGTTCRRMVDTANGDFAGRDTKEIAWKENIPCQGTACPAYKSKDCREIMNLQFMLPDVPGLGVWQVDTSSINSIRNINSAAAMIRAVYGRVSMIPLTLTLEPQEVTNPDDGKKKTVRVLQLRAKGTMRELMVEAAKSATVLLLPPMPEDDEAPVDNAGEIIETATVPAQVDHSKGDAEAIFQEDKAPPPAGKPPLPPPQRVDLHQTIKESTTPAPESKVTELAFKNAGEFYAACLFHFKLNKSDVEKEISMFDLTKESQRKQAWQSIVSVYGKKG
jgi:hypothetical protein